LINPTPSTCPALRGAFCFSKVKNTGGMKMNKFYLLDEIQKTHKPKKDWKQYNNDVDVAMYQENDTFIINFKGTDSNLDWKMNFSFWWKPYKKMDKLFLLHYGFVKNYHIVRDIIHREFRRSGLKKVHIRGYSHGGSLGTICYADFMWHIENKEEYKDVSLSGFVVGATRVSSVFGWKEFNRLSQGLIRLVNNNDLVTRVPFKTTLYKHVGTEHLIGSRRFWPFDAYSIAEHTIRSYKGHIKNEKYKDTKENNWLFQKASKILNKIYTGLAFIIFIIILLVVF
jgi:hypothetical protein